MHAVAILTLLLAGPKPAPLTIYVGPQVRGGFVQADQGIRDSVRDLREALAKDKALRVVETEEGARLRLYVAGRRRQAAQTVTVGSASNGSGSVVDVPNEIRILETTFRVGDYEQTFTAAKNQATDWKASWKNCAGAIARDVSAWVEANRERLTSNP